MSKDLFEVRWHGRGGQGAKTASLLFGDAALDSGMYIQAFPEYGPERMGAPVASFNRLSKKPINVHCSISSPDLVVVLDPTLMGKVDVTDGLLENGNLIVNTSLTAEEVSKNLNNKNKINVFVVDASGISKTEIGQDIPNTPMLGAMLKVSGLLDFDKTIKGIELKLKKKFANKPEIIEGNIKAIKRAYEEVTS
ncbi:pyruvate synthase [candidate division WOR-1 bacterium RIFOXYD2_FULL_36_8]|uniref:Pyruvate synthase n=1 Tax=candidate division WOR-1 bacterium RIFOXYB2_FULL_36_35 TaxID=1802578 RepID=A0A1F4S5K9_UNCSA|nr:MAG: pyruvate synthase [candidate division WOR-1 bacterium RIFOXYA2_FULL_36_21]OGC15725.1 MAG: pyruvate synthase [candidate division WOR-1 bacterium RIFOXYB2_FULL_36_35]OGC21080.1 MAG: pyruvate synthase [candidate division WOR-1 bacterium RIFOXYA12_FULL_36_13]OGC41260.1 MAG: pyruvate synthase [candidate division WOR-1 bacterium RIFOXYD2_FULL_36_8]